MTNNTIPNVPRELLEVIEQTWRIHYKGGPVTTDIAADAIEKGLGQLRALLSAPPPAGVEGLEVVGVLCISRFRNNPAMENVEFQLAADVEQGQHDLCRLSDAQAIIGGLQSTRAEYRELSIKYYDKLNEVLKERDQQAQRIGELEGLLRDCYQGCGLTARQTQSIRERIDAALSAGKEGE